MTNTDALTVLAADLTFLHTQVGSGIDDDDLKPEHYTARGYEQAIAAAAAACRAQHAARRRPVQVGAAL